MRNLYIISLNDSQNRMQSYRIAATTRILAEAAARTAAGVAEDAEPNTSQNSGPIDIEAD